jgi:hypothetical protein
MKRAVFFVIFSVVILGFSKPLRMLGQVYAFAFRVIYYDHVEKEGPYIEVRRGWGSILAVDRRVFPGDIPVIFAESREEGRKTIPIFIEGKEYIRKDFVEKGGIKVLFFPSKGVTFWNNGWFMQGKVGTIRPALVFSKRDGFTQMSTVIYPLEGRRMREALFDEEQKKIDHQSMRKIENQLRQYRLYHSDLMIWNFIQIEGKGLKVIDLEDVTRFPKYSLLFLKMHRRDKSKMEASEKAYEEIAALQRLQ